eukprot:PhF_6_TR9180/c1_g2_i5/m.14319
MSNSKFVLKHIRLPATSANLTNGSSPPIMSPPPPPSLPASKTFSSSSLSSLGSNVTVTTRQLQFNTAAGDGELAYGGRASVMLCKIQDESLKHVVPINQVLVVKKCEAGGEDLVMEHNVVHPCLMRVYCRVNDDDGSHYGYVMERLKFNLRELCEAVGDVVGVPYKGVWKPGSLEGNRNINNNNSNPTTTPSTTTSSAASSPQTTTTTPAG